MMVPIILAVITLVLSIIISRLSHSSKRKHTSNVPLPPGPPGIPFLGNLPSIPLVHSWLRFYAWSKQYGPLYRLNIAGGNHFIVSSEKVANDLLRDRGTIYSSREQLPAAVNLLSDHLRPLFWPYGDLLREGRKLMHQLCQPSAAAKYESTQELESTRFLVDLIEKPQQYEKWLNRYSAGLIFRLAFGKVLQEDDPLLERIYREVHHVERVASPGAYLVDIMPWLLYLPDCIAPFKRELKALHQEELDVFRTLLSDVETAMANKNAPDCWEKFYLENASQYNLTRDQGAYVVGTLFEAGAGTTPAAMMSFMLAMLLHPLELQRLQRDIDDVVGPERLPNFADIPRLPRVRAVVKEVMRWRPVTAGGVPHKSTQDDTYTVNGTEYFIPAGTNVHANEWAIHREEELYPDPEAFRPEPWLESGWPTYREPLDVHPNIKSYSAFGFGRRICPGMHIAERSLYLLVARMVWACEWMKKIGVDGKAIDVPDYDYTAGFNVQPKPFEFDLKIRNQAKWNVIRRAKEDDERRDSLAN